MSSKDKPTLGIIGAGTMGSGIALAALYQGYEVFLQDSFPNVLKSAETYIRKFLEKKDLSDHFENLTLTEDLEKLSNVGIVIEAIIEDLDVKQALFAKLEKICPTAILATNTSTLSITAIGSVVKDPSRVIGMHFFNPAPILPLVEVIRAPFTHDRTWERTIALAKDLGKTPVTTQDTPGFIVNRVARPFYGEALRILGEGIAEVEQIDLLVEKGAGFKMGPFQLMDLIGIDINTAAMRSMYEQTFGEPRYRPHWIQMQKMAAGDLGRKTGQGFYTYLEGTIVKSTIEKSKVSESGLKIFGPEQHPLQQKIEKAGHDYQSSLDKGEMLDFVILEGHPGKAELRQKFGELVNRLPSGVPVLIPVSMVTRSEVQNWLPSKDRTIVGYDDLFLGEAEAITLCFPDSDISDLVKGLFTSIGLTPVIVSDAPGLILPRIVCMLINEAAFAVQDQVAEADTIDLAMMLGVNYPKGLIAWGKELGWDRVLAVLENLYREYGEERYRPCRLIRQWARKS
jgi:3-hydroxybutyryl-CoA dehydrogenase